MKWIFPVKIVICLCALFLVQAVICAPQGLSAYKNYDIDRYSYENHPAARRAKYLYGAAAQSRLPQDQTTLSALNNKYHNNYNGNSITDPYAKRQYSNYKGYAVGDLEKYTRGGTSQTPAPNQINQADKENAKFQGANNQEADEGESGRGLAHFKLKRLKRLLRNRCLPFGRDAEGAEARSDDNAQDQYGRFLWDVNVYNLYAAPPIIAGPGAGHSNGCGGLLSGFLGGGGGPAVGGGGLFSDPVAPVYPISPLNNFLNMFAPGILQNALAATVPPPPPPSADQQYQNGPNVSPAYQQLSPQQQFEQQQYAQQQQQFAQQQPFLPQRPNRVYYDSPGAPPITPAQLVGGVATTVNGIIQQLTGNVQPVYQQPYG